MCGKGKISQEGCPCGPVDAPVIAAQGEHQGFGYGDLVVFID